MTPFAHAFAYAIKKTPYAFFAKITLCMYILCGMTQACTWRRILEIEVHDVTLDAFVKRLSDGVQY